MTTVDKDFKITGPLKVPLPGLYSGNPLDWEHWSCSLRNYVFLLYPDLDLYLDYVEKKEPGVDITDTRLTFSPLADRKIPVTGNLRGKQLEAYNRRVSRSQKLHYFLENLTSDVARTVAQSNLKRNGIETW